MEDFKYDFGGYATRNNVRCTDGRTILHGAFHSCNGTVVPLYWNHEHNTPDKVLGHALLEERDDGVYAYGSFNDTENGELAKKLVKHKDIVALSIYANQLQHTGHREVCHGIIREVSLVTAGANPKAFIDTVIAHSSDSVEEGIICTYGALDYDSGTIRHSDDKSDSVVTNVEVSNNTKEEEFNMSEQTRNVIDTLEHADTEETVEDVWNTLSEKQKTIVYALIGQAIEDNNDENNKEDNNMSHNVFDQDTPDTALMHADLVNDIFADMGRYGTLSNSALQHGVENLELLFPDAKYVNKDPYMIKREDGWVSKILNGVHHSPFSRIKSLMADITGDEARARGYIKGKFKKEEVFKLLKRATTPTTIYKKQKFDRDDLIDIADTMDFIPFLRAEMRTMLNEEIARACLIGDGRPSGTDDKISEDNIRPIWTDSDLFTVKVPVTVTANTPDSQKAKDFIKAVIKSRKNYKGSGNPTLYTTEDMVTEMLLIEDTTGRTIYESEAKLATTLRVKEIITVPVMEGAHRDVDGDKHDLAGIIVNPADYYVGADKGGQVAMYDDFDIDYNAQKYLIETRISGALVKPYSAMAIEFVTAGGADDGDIGG